MAVEHEASEEVIEKLRQKVLAASTSLPAKYRALFALRNLKGPSAEAALISGGSLDDPVAFSSITSAGSHGSEQLHQFPFADQDLKTAEIDIMCSIWQSLAG